MNEIEFRHDPNMHTRIIPIQDGIPDELSVVSMDAQDHSLPSLHGANGLAGDIAKIVLDTMKKGDGICKWVLECSWQTQTRDGRVWSNDVRYIQGVWELGKLKFSVQLNTKAIEGRPSKPVVLPLIDDVQEAGTLFISNKEANGRQMNLYLFHVDRVDEKIPFPWTGHHLKAYVSMCENAHRPNPVPVRYE